MKKYWFIKIGFFVVAGFLVLGLIVMGLWNWLVPVLFHGPMIDFLQAIGLLVLSRILLRGSCGMKGAGAGWKHSRWDDWTDKMDIMSPHEKERLRSLWRQRCYWSGVKPGNPSGDHTEKTPETYKRTIQGTAINCTLFR